MPLSRTRSDYWVGHNAIMQDYFLWQSRNGIGGLFYTVAVPPGWPLRRDLMSQIFTTFPFLLIGSFWPISAVQGGFKFTMPYSSPFDLVIIVPCIFWKRAVPETEPFLAAFLKFYCVSSPVTSLQYSKRHKEPRERKSSCQNFLLSDGFRYLPFLVFQ